MPVVTDDTGRLTGLLEADHRIYTVPTQHGLRPLTNVWRPGRMKPTQIHPSVGAR